MTPAGIDVDLGPVVPVATIGSREEAVPLARALAAGGLPAIEVTLRTSASLDAIAAIAAEVPEVKVGAGTVRSGAQVDAALAAGAAFLVTPAITPGLLDELAAAPVPVLPGVATPSEVAAVLERGIETMKLFPAEAIGGLGLLRALEGPFPEARFCPTGGIDRELAPRYLALPNVIAVGGSWLTRRGADDAGYGGVTAAAQEASRIFAAGDVRRSI